MQRLTDDFDLRSIAIRQLIVGIFLVVAGVLITAATFETARTSGERVLPFGPIFVGAIASVRGFAGMLQR
ncbi:MAG TPA: hypothetical protein VNO30_49375 [Kofleriaceae bacterium]|nr:hypothetical protein [Kofleriaceae bacterium]